MNSHLETKRYLACEAWETHRIVEEHAKQRCVKGGNGVNIIFFGLGNHKFFSLLLA